MGRRQEDWDREVEILSALITDAPRSSTTSDPLSKMASLSSSWNMQRMAAYLSCLRSNQQPRTLDQVEAFWQGLMLLLKALHSLHHMESHYHPDRYSRSENQQRIGW